MSKLIIHGAKIRCSMGSAPSALCVLPNKKTNCENQQAACVQDFRSNANIAPFGLCQSLSNPQVAAATAAAKGTLTPQPCVPVTTTPWSQGSSTVKIANEAALSANSKCACQWGGTIDVLEPTSKKTEVG